MAKTAHTFNEENIKYLRGILGDEKVDTFLAIGDEPERGTSEDQETYEKVKKFLEQMEKFGDDNSWWTNKDKKFRNYYYLFLAITR